jgi:hypothetical protein
MNDIFGKQTSNWEITWALSQGCSVEGQDGSGAQDEKETEKGVSE